MCFRKCSDFSQISFVSLQGFNKIGGLDGLWNKFGTSMGKPLTSTVAPATAATSNFTTVASALGTMTSSVASSLPGNDTVGSCYKLTSYWGNLWRPLDDPDYPWLGLWTSLFITSVWYFCTDQVTTLWNCHVSIMGGLITCSYKLNEANTFKQSFSVLMWHFHNMPTVECEQSYFFLSTRAKWR